MKISALLVSVAAALMLVASPSVQAKSPKVTKLTFPKGSHCTNYTGEYNNRIFTIYLLPNQTLNIRGDDLEFMEDIIVKNPKGRVMKPSSSYSDDYSWKTTTKGTYRIELIPSEGSNWYDDINFCAFYN